MKELCSNIISLKLTDSELADLKQRAESKGIGLSSYIKSELFQSNPPLLTTDRIVELIIENKEQQKLRSGDIFTIKSLFKEKQQEYESYANKSPAGRRFWTYATDTDSDIANIIEPIGGKPAKFKIK